jgi:hypothetical protein
MPEFTYEESDNYMAAEQAKVMSDGELKHAFFECLRCIKEAGFNSGVGLWRDTLTRELEKRGLMKDGRIINTKVK